MVKLAVEKAVIRSEAKEVRKTKARHKMCQSMVVHAVKTAITRSESRKEKTVAKIRAESETETLKIENEIRETGSKSKVSCRKRKFEAEEEEKYSSWMLKKTRYEISDGVARSQVDLSVARTGGQECGQTKFNVIFDQSPRPGPRNTKESKTRIKPNVAKSKNRTTEIKIRNKRKLNVRKDETKTKITHYFQTIQQHKATTYEGGRIMDKVNLTEDIHARRGMLRGVLGVDENGLRNSHFQLEYDHLGPDRSGEHPSS